MPETIQEQAVTYIETLLNGISTISGLQVGRDRSTEVEHFPSLVVVQDETDVDFEVHVGEAMHLLPVDIEGYCRANTQSELDAALDALYAASINPILADDTLGGLVTDVTLTSHDCDYFEGGNATKAGAFTASLLVQFFTSSTDLTVAV